MKCPKCGKELRRSEKDPNYGLCDNCMKKYKWRDYDCDFNLFTCEEKGKEIISYGEKVVLNLKSNGKYVITVTQDYITILQKGVMNALNRGFTGEKTFMFKNMSGVQYKSPGITTGYLQLILIGSRESKGGVTGAVKDENTILFSKKENSLILELKEFIEYKMTHSDNTPQHSNSELDEIRKLKELFDEGIISRDEFEIKKKQLLGI